MLERGPVLGFSKAIQGFQWSMTPIVSAKDKDSPVRHTFNATKTWPSHRYQYRSFHRQGKQHIGRQHLHGLARPKASSVSRFARRKVTVLLREDVRGLRRNCCSDLLLPHSKAVSDWRDSGLHWENWSSLIWTLSASSTSVLCVGLGFEVNDKSMKCIRSIRLT